MSVGTRQSHRPAHLRPAPPRVFDGGMLGEQLLLTATAAVSLASIVVLWSVDGGRDPRWLPDSVRAGVAVLAACSVPGVPVVLLLRLRSRVVAWSLAASLSLAVTVLLAYGSLLAGWWNPAALQFGLALVTLALVAGQIHGHWLPRPFAEAVRTAARALSRRGAALAALAMAVWLFLVQVRTLDVAGAGPLGIITQVGWPYMVAVALTAVVLAWALSRPRVDHLMMVLGCLVLVLLTTSLVSASTGETSVPTAWVHRGFIDMIVQAGQLPPPIDARFSWAGFFAGGAHLTAVAGLQDATPFLAPAPVVFDALLLAPLYAIGRGITGQSRTAWFGVVLYLLFNWYQQDYFAPQALALVWHTTVLGVLLWWWRAAPGPAVSGTVWRRLTSALRRTSGRPAGAGPGTALATEGLVMVLVSAMVVSHQLSPPVTIVSLLAFSLTGSTRFRLLWLAAALAFVAWFSLGAVDYWLGHLPQLLNDVGEVGENVQGGVGARLGEVREYRYGQYLRVAASGFLGLLALTGWLVRHRRRGWMLSGLLAGAPFASIFGQSYGGEVVIRCFLLASPVLAPLAASLLVRMAPRRRGRRIRGPGRAAMFVALAALLFAGAGVLTATRGLNTSFEATWTAERRVAERLEATVPAGTRIATWVYSPLFVSDRTIEDIRVGLLAGPNRVACLQRVVPCMLEQRPDYIFLTPGQEAAGVLTEGRPEGWLKRGAAGLLDTGEYVVEVETPLVTLLRRSDVEHPERAP